MTKGSYRRLRLFGGYVSVSSNDLYRLHVQVGALTFCVESKELYKNTKKNRGST